jgi:hypothetical protein
VIGGGIWFYVSKPFRTQVKDSFNSATEWTPENIKANPAGYLTWALDEATKTEKKLETSSFSLESHKNDAEKALGKFSAEKSQYEKLLGELKEAFKTASHDKKWPVEVHGQTLNEGDLKRRLVECHDAMRDTTSLMDTYARTKKVIDDKQNEIKDKLSEVKQLKSTLSTNIELAKANDSVGDIEAIGGQINKIESQSSALIHTAEESKSVADMIKPSSQSHVDEEFSKIMGDSK